jgi:voltage-gated potassium channel
VAPVRHLALYHIDGALTEDLVPVLAVISAQPALALRDGLGTAVNAPDEGDEIDEAGQARAVPRQLSPDEATRLLEKAVNGRFATLRDELARVGTVALPAWKRRPSALHERARRARQRTSEKIESWEDYARSVVDYRRRLDASTALHQGFGADAGVFLKQLNARFDVTIAAPMQRASAVLASARERVRDAQELDGEAIEALLTEVGEAVSQGLRRRTLATLRRGLDTKPFDRELSAFGRTVERRLDELPPGFRVVDPARLPHPEEPLRAYPDPADHQFQLIATGTIERTIQPAFVAVRKQTQAALEHAEEVVNELRHALERRFDAAIDAVIEEGHEGEARSYTAENKRRSVEIAESALESAEDRLTKLSEETFGVREKIAAMLGRDFDALVIRLDSQLASAHRLEARFQARRVLLERQGTVALRLFIRRLRRHLRALLERFGLVRDDERDERETHFRPGGPAGSDRAVLFDILFSETTLSGKIFDGVLILTILASIAVLMLESVEPFRLQHSTSLGLLEWLFTLLFTAEYAARLWAVARPARYAFSFFGLIDFVAVLPTYLSLLVPGGQFLMVIRVLRVARAFRVLKLARYVGEAQVLVDAMKASQYKITVFLVYVVSVAVVVGSAMYLIEGPEAGFTSIPRGVYWSIVTLTTVGFGDITPQTPLGQTLAAFLMIMGYGIIAVPTGIVTAQIATARPRSGDAQTCGACGAEELDAQAAFCRACGTKFTL